MHQHQTALENIVGKGEISPFPTMFSTQSHNVSPFVHIFDIISLFAAELEKPTMGISGKGLSTYSQVLAMTYSPIFFFIKGCNDSNNFR